MSVEVEGTIYNTVTVCHSDYPSEKLEFDVPEWLAFLQGVKAGEFDLVYLPDEDH